MSDAMAIGVLRAARELGLRVPEDVSVVGFDDIDISQHTNPPLTTVHQPIRQKGESAVRLLLSVVERRDQRPEQHPARDPAHRPGLDRTGAASAAGGEPGPTLTVRRAACGRESSPGMPRPDHIPWHVERRFGPQGRARPDNPAGTAGRPTQASIRWRRARPG